MGRTTGNCSDLRGNEQPAAFQEGVKAPGSPGSKEGCQRHFAVAARLRASPATDFTADHRVAQTPFGGIIVRWGLRVRHEDEQLPVSSTGQALDMPLNPPAELGLHCQRVFQERQAQRQQPVFQCQLSSGRRASPGRRPFPAFGVKPLHSQCPLGQPAVFWVQDLQRVNVPQQSLPPTPVADRGMYFILRLTQLIVRPDSRLGVLRYKIAPKCLLPGPFGHSGVGGNPGVAGTVRSYNLVFTYPYQDPGIRTPVGGGPNTSV